MTVPPFLDPFCVGDPMALVMALDGSQPANQPGTIEQVMEGLTALADLESGNCTHDGPVPPDCVRCRARRMLWAIRKAEASE